MNIFQAIILGIVQGVTEFIPVSSSGHLVLVHDWLGVTGGSLVFDVALHFGTLIALLIFFHKDITRIIRAIFVKDDFTKLAWILILATIPAVIAGFLLQDVAEPYLRSPTMVAIGLIIGALLMIGAEKYSKNKDSNSMKKVSLGQGLFVGFAQALALIPGMSRSGSTITAGLFAGIERKEATRFAFLLGAPIILGAIVKTLLSDGTISHINNESAIFATGILTSFVFGLLAIKFMLKYLSKNSLNGFAYYRITLGVVVLAYAVLQ